MKEKKQTFTVLFWIRKGRTSENMAPLHCRVTISGQRYEIPMNIYLPLQPFPLLDRKSTRLNSSHLNESRMPSSA